MAEHNFVDLEFFFDPTCPWAWVTSRWVTEVQSQRPYDVTWRFISQRVFNEPRIGVDPDYDDEWQQVHVAGLRAHRVCAYVRDHAGNAAVAALYTAIGTQVQLHKRRPVLVADPVGFMQGALRDAGLPVEWAESALDEAHDTVIRAETEVALRRVGGSLGAPVVTFRPGEPDEASLFGPVISYVPRGENAVRMWDAVATLAAGGVAELKRSTRDPLRFE